MKSIALKHLILDAQSGFASGVRDPDGVIQVRMNNVSTDGVLDLSDSLRVPASEKETKKYSLVPGDVLFNATNSPELVGKTAYFHGHKEPIVFSNHFIRIRTDTRKLDSSFLSRWLNQQWQHRVFENRCIRWVNQASFRREDLLDLAVPLPGDVDQQKRIAAILDKADAIRRKRQLSIQLANEFIRSVFLDMFGDIHRNPKGWKPTALGDWANIITGFAFPSDEFVDQAKGIIRLCRGANVLPRQLDWSDTVWWPSSESAEYRRFQLNEGDVVLALDRPWISSGLKVARVSKKDTPSLLVQRVARVRGDTPAESLFFYYAINSPAFEKHCRPTETTIPHISPIELRAYAVPRPPASLIVRFYDYAQVTLRNLDTMEAVSGESERLFLSCSQRAFRGEL